MLKGRFLRLLAAAASGTFLFGSGCLGLGGLGGGNADVIIRILQEELFS